jgi:hypothetical protein
VASEALLFAADRKGCRLEFGPEAPRAAREWGEYATRVSSPEELVAFYAAQGAVWFADLPASQNRDLIRLHEHIRNTYAIVADGPDGLVARLRPESSPHASP